MAGKYAGSARRPTSRFAEIDLAAVAPDKMGKPTDRKATPVLLVHAGACKIPEEYRDEYLAGVRAAANYGYIAMLESKSALDGVEAAVLAMENNPILSAGVGSAVNADGRVECDAGIMDGRHMKAGAVGCVSTVKNPIRVARAVMEKTDHVLLVGTGAERFALKMGIPKVENAQLVTSDGVKRLKKHGVFNKAIRNLYSAWASLTKEVSSSRTDLTEYRRSEPPGSGRRSAGEYRAPATLENATHTPPDTGPLSGLKDVWPSTEQESGTCDSVGCVALDMNGRTAVAVSTGGITGKLAGRLGDACVPGSGFYADDNYGTVCCTGHGEMIMKAATASRVLSSIARGKSAQAAAQEALDFMRIRLDGFGGIIAISASGGIGLGFSTFRMPWAYRTADELHYGIDRDDHFVQKPGDPFDMPKVRYKGKR